MKKEGYYFVKYQGEWIIAELSIITITDTYWNVIGNEDEYYDNDFDEIGNFICTRENVEVVNNSIGILNLP